MPITLISESERHSVSLGDATVFYRRVPSYLQKKIEATHTKRGQVDQRGVVDEVLAYALLGWEGVVDAEGQPVAFSADLIKYLPEESKAEIIAHLYAADPTGRLLPN
jgi:hypothetical protein